MHVGAGNRPPSPSLPAREDGTRSHPGASDAARGPHPGVGSDRRPASAGRATFADLLLEVEDGDTRSAAHSTNEAHASGTANASGGGPSSERDADPVDDPRDPTDAGSRPGSRTPDRAPAVVTRVARALVAPATSAGPTRVRFDLTAAGLPGREVTLTHTASGVVIAFSGGMGTGAGAELARSLPDLLHHLRHAGVDVADVSLDGRSAGTDPDGRGDQPGPEEDDTGEEPSVG